MYALDRMISAPMENEMTVNNKISPPGMGGDLFDYIGSIFGA